MVAVVVLSIPPTPLSLFAAAFSSFEGCPPPHRHAQSKQSSVNTGWKTGKHGFVVTCVLTE